MQVENSDLNSGPGVQPLYTGRVAQTAPNGQGSCHRTIVGLVRGYLSQSSKLYGVLEASEHSLYAFLSRFGANGLKETGYKNHSVQLCVADKMPAADIVVRVPLLLDGCETRWGSNF